MAAVVSGSATSECGQFAVSKKERDSLRKAGGSVSGLVGIGRFYLWGGQFFLGRARAGALCSAGVAVDGGRLGAVDAGEPAKARCEPLVWG